MGNSKDGAGYGCELPAMVESWRKVWSAPEDALFGVATLAAGGSEGAGHHMAGMRWSQTANYGVLPNAKMPHSFLAQVYDLGEFVWGVWGGTVWVVMGSTV
jgi:sialate O-acetylesterase